MLHLSHCIHTPPPLFPYTTLFRSGPPAARPSAGRRTARGTGPPGSAGRTADPPPENLRNRPCAAEVPGDRVTARSEEHTSELQSRGHLVCRLLLEKNNKQ